MLLLFLQKSCMMLSVSIKGFGDRSMAKSIVKLAFIGSGNMGSAIIRGFVSHGGVPASSIFVYDKNQTNYDALSKLNVVTVDTIEAAISNADFIFLCVKPQIVSSVVKECASCSIFDSSSIFVSIAAAVSVSLICKSAGRDVAVIRAMPNTPMLIGKGAIAICKNEFVDNKRFANVCRMFSSIATVSVVDESMMVPVIAVSGSSPAYVYYFIKSLLDEAVAQGFTAEQALPLITSTVIGSAKMIESADCSIEELIQRVCSPKGTTLEAMNVLRDEHFSDIISRAMRACNKRAEEISLELES